MIVSATNVHLGGGAVLLRELVSSYQGDERLIVLVDKRFQVPANLDAEVVFERVEPRILDRIRAERRLVELAEEGENVICFGNLPPLFPLRGRVTVFLQNRYLIDPEAPFRKLDLRVSVRLLLEKAWLKFRGKNADRYVVQTPSMKRLAMKALKHNVEICSFVPNGVFAVDDNGSGFTDGAGAQKDFDFVYVASGEAHKSHQALLDAWKLLASEQLYPSLCLTLPEDRFSGKWTEIREEAGRYGLQITNQSDLTYEEVQKLYKNARAMIFPSTFESFGLPLIEARKAGLPILASELDYVRDVVEPAITFDPRSPISIMRAVKRFLNREQAQVTLCDGSAFWALARNQAPTE